jgi:hypothetical protein
VLILVEIFADLIESLIPSNWHHDATVKIGASIQIPIHAALIGCKYVADDHVVTDILIG